MFSISSRALLITKKCRPFMSVVSSRCLSSTMSSHDKFSLPARYGDGEKSVWVEYVELAQKTQPINLGQGFPDFAAPAHITQALAEVASSPNVLLSQYTRGFGHLRLVSALSKLYSKLIGRNIDPHKEILITAGAYEALFSVVLGHTGPGDEVVIIEPFFDCYLPMVVQGGAVPRSIPLELKKKDDGPVTSADWVLDTEKLKSLFNEKTKAIILNTPNNPIGKVFTLEELTLIADLCKKWNVLCISDEVYEWLVYKPAKHIRIATLPGMWERTITIGSAGKTFSVTGWKTGWAYGPENLLSNATIVHQNTVYNCCTPIQEAIARGFEIELERLDSPDCYFNSLAEELLPKRDFMANFLSEIGLVPTIPEGGYFMLADWSAIENKIDMSSENDKYKDYRFTKWMSKKLKVQGIPPTAFYTEPNKLLMEYFVRFCFIKKDENLQKAADILKNWKA